MRHLALGVQMTSMMALLPAQPAMARRMRSTGRRWPLQRALRGLLTLQKLMWPAHLGSQLPSLSNPSNQPLHQVMHTAHVPSIPVCTSVQVCYARPPCHLCYGAKGAAQIIDWWYETH